jgi:D-glycero-alpha-D-manno-heptose 1-phosphate guanylyltransferase
MIKEAIILAGGLGTRLRNAVPDLPKCMAPVSGKPFLFYVIDHLQKQGIDKFIFSLGYKSEVIIEYTKKQYSKTNLQYSIENEPLGTGGGIKLALSKATEKNVLVLNGDTLFSINIKTISALHEAKKADCTLALKPMQNFERYGVVELNSDLSVASFKEKRFYKKGLINGGVYALNAERFIAEGLPEKFSFEKDYLESYYNKRNIYGIVQDEYFIDIGIPEDFERAQQEL